IGIPSWSGCFRCPRPLCAVSASGITCTLWMLPSWRGSKKISRGDWWKNGEWVWKRCFTTPPTSTRSFPRRTPRSWRSGDTPRANAPIYASWAWPCWFPGIFIFLSSPRSTRATRTTRSPSAGFWTIWSLATRCSAGNARTSPGFAIRETTRRHQIDKPRALRDLQKRIARSHEPGWRGKPYPVASIQKNLGSIISGQYIQDFLWGQVTRKRGRLGMAFGTDDEAYRKLKERILGKRILFTDRTDLSDEQIIFGYRGQHHIERAFRDMKDPYCICFSPPRHWTDQMLRVHAFSCVLAVTLVSLLHRRVAQAGV